MKELIEKMREANPYSGFTEQHFKVVNDIIDICAEIAASHYENKWVSVDSGVLPEEDVNCLGVSVDLYIYCNLGIEEGWYDFDEQTYYEATGGRLYAVTHYMPKELPTPPNSDKNVEDKG